MLLLTWLLLTGDPTSPTGRCEVEVVGIPAAAQPDHWVVVGESRPQPLRDRVVEVTAGPEPVEVKVGGPRYEGELVLGPGKCDGSRLPLKARPRPVVLNFKCAPDDLVVRCTSCSRPARRYMAVDMPAILPADIHGGVVELELKARGFKTQRKRVAVLPGPNELHVKLEPLTR